MDARRKPEATARGVTTEVADHKPITPKPITPTWLERSALHYLERYAASADMLRRVLARRVEKRARARGEEAAAFADLVEATVARAVAAGLVDDARFAEMRLSSLRRRGASARGAAAKLAQKGVRRETVAAALEAETQEEDPEVVEMRAALAYAKRRRLGPHRPLEARTGHRDRDLAAMARAGFPYALARRVVEAEPADEDPTTGT